MADHLGLDLHLVEGLAVVHAHHAAHHLGQNNHIAQVRLHHLGLFHGRRLLLGLAQALQQRVLLPPQAPIQTPPLPRAVQLHQLLVGHVQQLVEVHAAVRELAKGPLLLLFHFRHPFFRKDLSFCTSAVIAESPKSAFLNEYYISVCLETYI